MAKRDRKAEDQAALGASTVPHAVPVGSDPGIFSLLYSRTPDKFICQVIDPQKLLPPALLQPRESSKGQEQSP